MAPPTLYTAPFIRAKFTEILAKHYKLDVKFVSKDDPSFAANFPLKKLPALTADKGYKLNEIIAVVFYLIELIKEPHGLLGKKDDLPQILKWLSLTNSELIPAVSGAFKPLRGDVPYNKKVVETKSKEADAVISVFEDRLVNHTYLVGERLTIADYFAAGLLVRGFDYLWGKDWRAKHPVFVRWFKTVIASPFFSSSELIKNFKFIEKPLEFTPPKKAAKAPAADKKPKAAKKEAAPAEAPAEKKAAHPLSLLPRTTIPIDEWKRVYSNEDTREKALPYFWNTFYNNEEWSLWKVEFKYNDELTLTFMSNNLIGGFFSRLQGSLKYIFGSMSVYGVSNDSVISGAFVIRGQDFKPAFDVAPDWESYSFTKLDASKPEDKAFVDDAWAWDAPLVVNGVKKEHADGKVCK